MSTNQTCNNVIIIHTTGEEKSQTDTSTGIGPIIGLQIIQAHNVCNRFLLVKLSMIIRQLCNTEVEISSTLCRFNILSTGGKAQSEENFIEKSV